MRWKPAPVRSILGVAQTDRMPKEELVTTTYITRQIVTDKSQAEIWQYKLQKQHDHTLDSFPSAALLNDTVAALSVIKQNKKRNTYLLLGKVWISLAITSAATSFPVLMIAPRVLTWARIIASYGLFIALAGSSIMWSQIYMREQLSTTYRYNIPLFSTLNRFAAIRSKSGPFRALIADLRTLDSRHENICRFISFFSAAVICLG